MDEEMNELEARFYQLSPAELATLWLANDLEKGNDSKPTILASSTTIILMIVLAEGFVRLRSESIADNALFEIAKYSKELVSHLAERGSYVRYDLPVRKLIERLEEIGFPILPEDSHELTEVSEKKRPASSLSYEYASKLYKATLNSLEASNLLIDPPWYESPLAVGSLIVLLGSVPLEINVKTVDGQKVVTSIESKFWAYENSNDGNVENTHINIKLAKFIDRAVENLGTGFVDAWKEQNPERTQGLEHESNRLSHNK
jgi:hypothetical protein